MKVISPSSLKIFILTIVSNVINNLGNNYINIKLTNIYYYCHLVKNFFNILSISIIANKYKITKSFFEQNWPLNKPILLTII